MRSINKDLGAKVNRFKLFARAAVHGINPSVSEDSYRAKILNLSQGFTLF